MREIREPKLPHVFNASGLSAGSINVRFHLHYSVSIK
jgi:hypothetical protein